MANGIQKDLGKVTAYSYAKAAGYTGTEEQFQAIFNEFTENAPGLIDRMDTAVARAEAAVTNIDATVQDAVDDAVEEATASAVATANQAVTDAQAAQAAAEGAVTQANAAVTQANSAVSAAQAAQAAAEDAAESFVLDRTLTDSGAAAPADLVGNLKESIGRVGESLDTTDIRNAYPSSVVGETVSFTNSSTTKTFVDIISVEKGKKYEIKIANGTTVSSTNTRNAVIVDSNDVVRQVIEIPAVANTTKFITFTAYQDGDLILAVDKNYVEIGIDKLVVDLQDVNANKNEVTALGSKKCSSNYTWTLKRNYDGSGTFETQNGMALTNYIAVVPGDAVVNLTPVIGYNNKASYVMVHEFTSANVWLQRSGVGFGKTYTVQNETCAKIRIAYGYAAAQNVTITQEIVDTYFSAILFQEAETKSHADIVTNTVFDTEEIIVDLSKCEEKLAIINSQDKWISERNYYTSYLIDVSSYMNGTVTVEAQPTKGAVFSFLATNAIGLNGTNVSNWAGTHTRKTVSADSSSTLSIPSDCVAILVSHISSKSDISPLRVTINATVNQIDALSKSAKNDSLKFSDGVLEIAAMRAINSDSDGRDIPQCVGVQNAYRKSRQLINLEWTALAPYPNTNTPATYNPAGNYTAVPYSSTREYLKHVGYNVSIKTFMTAAHNPYSVLYTEDILATNQQSSYGIEYHGTNCGPYFGAVCTSYAMWMSGDKIPWPSNSFFYLEKIGKLYRIPDQSATGVRLMDVVWEPGHAFVVTDIYRDARGNPTTIYTAEYGPYKRTYTAETFNARLSTEKGIIFCYTDLYKNLEFTPSEFLDSEVEYDYNDDICTFAGDYACFNSDEDIYINYTAGAYTQMEIYKNDSLLNTIDIDSDSHSVKITTDGYGKYKARLKAEDVYSNYTFFEILDTTVSASYASDVVTINFSSENSTPVYAEVIDRAGNSKGIIPIDDYARVKGTVSASLNSIITEQCPGTPFDFSNAYARVIFQGDYGSTPNAFYQLSIS